MITCKNLYENKNIESIEARGDVKSLSIRKI